VSDTTGVRHQFGAWASVRHAGARNGNRDSSSAVGLSRTLTLPAIVAEIVVSRPEERRANRLRAYKVLVDGELAATLGRGESATVSVASGRHAVKATLDWGSSPTLDVDLGAGERAYLLCQSAFQFSLSRPRALLYITVWRNRYLDLKLLRVERAA
jgi:hypothetical protein